MTYTDVAQMIADTGIQNAYYQFTADTAVPPPFICFFYDGSADLAADNTNYQRIRPLTVELYTEVKDYDMEAVVEKMLNDHGLVYSREEEPIDSERLYLVVYSTSIVIEEESNG